MSEPVPDQSPDRSAERSAVTGTALWIAAARARESARPDALFRDPWAEALAGADGRARLAASEQASGGQNAYLPIRTRFFDDTLIAATWAQQVVLLGAGMDTRAYRLGLPASSTVFEVDHSEIFTARRAVLQDAAPTCRRVEVIADLAQDWGPILLGAGLDPDVTTVWLAEGLLFYLTPAAVERLLATAAALSQSRAMVCADVFGTGLLRLPGMRPLIDHRRRTGQPLPFCTDEPGQLLSACGWRMDGREDPGRLAVRYGRPAPRPTTMSVAAHDPTLRTHLVLGSRSR